MSKMDDFFRDPKHTPPIGTVTHSIKNMSSADASKFAKAVNRMDDIRALQDSGSRRGTGVFDDTCKLLKADPALIRRQLDSIEADYIVAALEDRKSDRDLPIEPLSRRDIISASYDALENNHGQ